MDAAADPVRAVAAWIDGRLDLAFNDEIQSDLRQMSLEAQSQMFAAPELVGPAYGEILRPLVEQLAARNRTRLFTDIDPADEALSIQGVVWANVERHWAAGGLRPRANSGDACSGSACAASGSPTKPSLRCSARRPARP